MTAMELHQLSFGRLLKIGVARVLDWREGRKTINHMLRRHKQFLKEEIFVKKRYRSI